MLELGDPRHGTENGYNNLHCRCDACRAASAAYRRALHAGACSSCGGPVWDYGDRRTGLCRRCWNETRVTSVRDDTLRCTVCREWKPDDAFSPCRAKIGRRGRHTECKACAAARKRERRARARAAA